MICKRQVTSDESHQNNCTWGLTDIPHDLAVSACVFLLHKSIFHHFSFRNQKSKRFVPALALSLLSSIRCPLQSRTFMIDNSFIRYMQLVQSFPIFMKNLFVYSSCQPMIGTVMSNATEKKQVLNKKKCNLLREEMQFLT